MLNKILNYENIKFVDFHKPYLVYYNIIKREKIKDF